MTTQYDYTTDDHSTLPADPAPARSHANVDAGTYTARFARWHWDTSKKGDMCLAAMLRITGGPFDGQQVRGTLYFDTDKADKSGRTAADRSLETLRAMGLTGEIRRQLGPLGRQAETARRAAVIQADALDARLRLLADDLVQLTSTLEQEVADETALIARRADVELALATAVERARELETAAEEARPTLAATGLVFSASLPNPIWRRSSSTARWTL